MERQPYSYKGIKIFAPYAMSQDLFLSKYSPVLGPMYEMVQIKKLMVEAFVCTSTQVILLPYHTDDQRKLIIATLNNGMWAAPKYYGGPDLTKEIK